MKRDVIYEGHILNLTKLDDKWEVVEHVPAVCVLAIKENQVLGVMQERPAIGQKTWELPAGLIDDGETPAQAALRELAEETQLSGKLESIAEIYSSPGFCTEKIFIFEVTDLVPTEGQPDEGEELEIQWRDLKEIWQEVSSGNMPSSAPTALALSYALGRRGLL